jgi:hypothetical protein
LSAALVLMCGACGQEGGAKPDPSVSVVVTTASTSSRTSVTEPAGSVYSEVSLRSDGLGVISFGEPADTAAAVLIDR